MIKSLHPQRRKQGLSLIELLAVVVIILAFSMVSLTTNSNATRSAEEVTYQQQRAQLQKALSTWVASQPSLTDAINAWNAKGPTAETLLDRAPDANGKDAWAWRGGPMSLLSAASHRQFSKSGNGYITTRASTQLGKGFGVSWSDPKRNNEPAVDDVDL